MNGMEEACWEALVDGTRGEKGREALYFTTKAFLDILPTLSLVGISRPSGGIGALHALRQVVVGKANVRTASMNQKTSET